MHSVGTRHVAESSGYCPGCFYPTRGGSRGASNYQLKLHNCQVAVFCGESRDMLGTGHGRDWLCPWPWGRQTWWRDIGVGAKAREQVKRRGRKAWGCSSVVELNMSEAPDWALVQGREGAKKEGRIRQNYRCTQLHLACIWVPKNLLSWLDLLWVQGQTGLECLRQQGLYSKTNSQGKHLWSSEWLKRWGMD